VRLFRDSSSSAIRTAGAPPSGSDWIHDVKADGYRGEIVINGGVIKVHSRRGYDWSKGQFAAISEAAEFLRDRDLVMDGEVVALNSAGRSDFNLLRHELAKRNWPYCLPNPQP
jgi:bifunctional non-homologous end joining protein LigD